MHRCAYPGNSGTHYQHINMFHRGHRAALFIFIRKPEASGLYTAPGRSASVADDCGRIDLLEIRITTSRA
jgi:hypothetical protein